jgi:hypothetical protein
VLVNSSVELFGTTLLKLTNCIFDGLDDLRFVRLYFVQYIFVRSASALRSHGGPLSTSLINPTPQSLQVCTLAPKGAFQTGKSSFSQPKLGLVI